MKIAFGSYDPHYGYMLRPIKHVPFMAVIPAAIFETKDDASAAAKEHGYKIAWDETQATGV